MRDGRKPGDGGRAVRIVRFAIRISTSQASWVTGGERGIRTLDRILSYTPLAGARLRPLGHLSVISCRVIITSSYLYHRTERSKALCAGFYDGLRRDRTAISPLLLAT